MRPKNLGLIAISVLCLGISSAQDQALDPLEGALWEGVLRIEVEGPLFSQYLQNILKNNRLIVGFIKEKGNMDVDFVLEIRFQINSLGETTLLATENFNGQYMVNREMRNTYKEEIYMKSTRTNFVQKVQASQTTVTKIQFTNQDSYDSEAFQFGSLRFFPSGRMDRRGEIRITGDLEMPFVGKGTVDVTKERQPPSKDDPPSATRAEIVKTILMPLQFDFKIPHRKEVVSGQFNVKAPAKDPFPLQEGDNARLKRSRNQLKAKGTYTLTPLFSEKNGGRSKG